MKIMNIFRLFKKHQHNYSIPVNMGGFPFLKCDSCNTHLPVYTEEEKRREEWIDKQLKELGIKY